MWLRDDIPRDAPSARIMSYGYLSNLQDGTTCNSIQDHSLKFLRGLIDLREECQVRAQRIFTKGVTRANLHPSARAGRDSTDDSDTQLLIFRGLSFISGIA